MVLSRSVCLGRYGTESAAYWTLRVDARPHMRFHEAPMVADFHCVPKGIFHLSS